MTGKLAASVYNNNNNNNNNNINNLIIIPVITFTHGIYNYVPETNQVTTAHNVTAVLYLQSVLHVMLFAMLNMSCTFTLALRAVCVQRTVRLVFAVP
jgi:hypothetical protein